MDRQFFGPTAACVQAVDIVWKTLTELGLTGGKSKPLVGTFTGPIDGQVMPVSARGRHNLRPGRLR